MSDEPTIADLCAPPSAVDGKHNQRSRHIPPSVRGEGSGQKNPRVLFAEHDVIPLHSAGKTIHEIAVETDIPAWIVIRTLRKAGLIE